VSADVCRLKSTCCPPGPRSLGLLYDHRNALAQLTRLVVARSEAFNGLVEMERSTLSERSRKLFTLSAIYSGNAALVGDREVSDVKEEARRCAEFWDEIAKYIPEWGLVRKSKMTAGEVRRDFLHSHAIALQALGIAGQQLLDLAEDKWKARLKALAGLDWGPRSNARLWEGRTMIGGRVSKASQNVTLTVNLLKQRLKIPLTPEEERAEDALRRGRDAA
jgi:DNA sulfur modification protein DndB